MGKVITKTRSDAAKEIASVFGVTPSYVRMVVNGQRKNEKILEAYSAYLKGKESLLKNINPSTEKAA